MRYFYKVYGLNFCSQDLEFPQLIPLLSDNKIIDVNIFKDNLKNWSPLKNSKFDTEFLIINSGLVKYVLCGRSVSFIRLSNVFART